MNFNDEIRKAFIILVTNIKKQRKKATLSCYLSNN